jgi:tRNA threonylcarbamoyladenosine biosynthesis protein TsaB
LALLVIDTCLSACQAALVDGRRVLAGASEPMERGHQERLAGLVRALAADADVPLADLEKIAVTVGPGSFTGLRVGLAFAKGLAFATGAPLAGIGTLEALAASWAGDGAVAGVVDARRGLVYVQAFECGTALGEPEVAPAAAIGARWRDRGLTAVGPGARLLADWIGADKVIELAAPHLSALTRLATAAEPSADLRPLYMRAPDARLPA